MSLLIRIYFNAVFGGLGGLLGWVLFGAFFDPKGSGALHWLLGGAVIGCSIGYFVVSVEAIRDRSLVRFSRLASYGLLLGAAGGALGFLLGELIYSVLIQPIGADRSRSGLYLLGAAVVRGLGWMILGLAVGISEGIAARSLGKFGYGAIGGALGGLTGGFLFGLFYTAAFRRGDPTLIWGAVGLVIVGASIGSLTALVQGVFQPASVKVMRGWQEGREYPLDKPSNRLCRDEHADIALFRDMRAEQQHAQIHRQVYRCVGINTNAPAGFTRVKDDAVSNYHELNDGEDI